MEAPDVDYATLEEDIEEMKNPLFSMKEWISDWIIDPIMNMVARVKSAAGTIYDAVVKIADLNPLANGGYVQPMANGGSAGRKPYLVGEVGPEIFIPQTAGKIIPNKDLNTQRVKGLLAEAFGLAPRTGAADKVHKLSGTLKVERLDVQSAKMKKSRFGVDTFA